jgi:hypothetical protein
MLSQLNPLCALSNKVYVLLFLYVYTLRSNKQIYLVEMHSWEMLLL